MIFNNKKNLCQEVADYKTGYKNIFKNWLIIVSIALILNILIVILAVYLLTIINNKDITIPRPDIVINSEKIDKNLLDKIIAHFEAQKKIGENWVQADHILVDPSL
jgi:hypothetical protein